MSFYGRRYGRFGIPTARGVESGGVTPEGPVATGPMVSAQPPRFPPVPWGLELFKTAAPNALPVPAMMDQRTAASVGPIQALVSQANVASAITGQPVPPATPTGQVMFPVRTPVTREAAPTSKAPAVAQAVEQARSSDDRAAQAAAKAEYMAKAAAAALYAAKEAEASAAARSTAQASADAANAREQARIAQEDARAAAQQARNTAVTAAKDATTAVEIAQSTPDLQQDSGYSTGVESLPPGDPEVNITPQYTSPMNAGPNLLAVAAAGGGGFLAGGPVGALVGAAAGFFLSRSSAQQRASAQMARYGFWW